MQIKAYKDLQELHTFGVPWSCEVFCSIQSVGDAIAAVDYAREQEIDIFILGGGSNILPTQDTKGLVIKNEIGGRAVMGETEDGFTVRVGSGENWHDLVEWSVVQGMHGLENLALIPGTVGGAVVQNIGAYDVELGSRVVRVDLIDLETGEERVFGARECEFAYRNSIFKKNPGRFMVTSVDLVLDKEFVPIVTYKSLKEWLGDNKQVNAQAVMAAVIAIRSSKLPNPDKLGTAGSFFANPRVSKTQVDKLHTQYPDMPVFQNYNREEYTVPAGWLIEHLETQVENTDQFLYSKHALVVINQYKNQNQVSGDDIFTFTQNLQAEVAGQYGIQLTPEVVVL